MTITGCGVILTGGTSESPAAFIVGTYREGRGYACFGNGILPGAAREGIGPEKSEDPESAHRGASIGIVCEANARVDAWAFPLAG